MHRYLQARLVHLCAEVLVCTSPSYQVNRRNRRVAPCSGLLQKIFTHSKDKEESLEVREGIFPLLNCSIHGVLPLCMEWPVQ